MFNYCIDGYDPNKNYFSIDLDNDKLVIKIESKESKDAVNRKNDHDKAFKTLTNLSHYVKIAKLTHSEINIQGVAYAILSGYENKMGRFGLLIDKFISFFKTTKRQKIINLVNEISQEVISRGLFPHAPSDAPVTPRQADKPIERDPSTTKTMTPRPPATTGFKSGHTPFKPHMAALASTLESKLLGENKPAVEETKEEVSQIADDTNKSLKNRAERPKARLPAAYRKNQASEAAKLSSSTVETSSLSVRQLAQNIRKSELERAEVSKVVEELAPASELRQNQVNEIVAAQNKADAELSELSIATNSFLEDTKNIPAADLGELSPAEFSAAIDSFLEDTKNIPTKKPIAASPALKKPGSEQKVAVTPPATSKPMTSRMTEKRAANPKINWANSIFAGRGFNDIMSFKDARWTTGEAFCALADLIQEGIHAKHFDFEGQPLTSPEIALEEAIQVLDKKVPHLLDAEDLAALKKQYDAKSLETYLIEIHRVFTVKDSK